MTFTLAISAGHWAGLFAFTVGSAVLFLLVPWWANIFRQIKLIFGLSTKSIPFTTRVLRIACAGFFVVGVSLMVVALVQTI